MKATFRFNIGDCVRVIGYPGKTFTVHERFTTEFEGMPMKAYRLAPYGESLTEINMIVAFEVDMEVLPIPVEFTPIDRRLPKRRKITLEEIYEHIDRKLDLYNLFGDERYLRHARRLKQWADKRKGSCK